MRLLLDTHILLWAAAQPERLPDEARTAIEEPANQLVFSVASIWEVAIKQGLGRPEFSADPRRLRQGLIDAGYAELAVLGEHALAAGKLPRIHRDPFDRLLIAQAVVEDIVLMTADPVMGRYPGPVRLV